MTLSRIWRYAFLEAYVSNDCYNALIQKHVDSSLHGNICVTSYTLGTGLWSALINALIIARLYEV